MQKQLDVMNKSKAQVYILTRKHREMTKHKNAINIEDLPPTDGEWEYDGLYNLRWHSTLNGEMHNSLGPAAVYDSGLKQWWVNGQRHRLDGPAAEWADGTKFWVVDGQKVSEQDFPNAVISFLLGVDREIAELVEQEIE